MTSSIDEILDNIRLIKAKEKGIVGFWGGHKGAIFKTFLYQEIMSIDPVVDSKKFKPEKIAPLAMAFVITAFLITLLTLTLKLHTTQATLVLFIAFLVLGIALFDYIKDRLWDVKKNYLLTVSREGIAFNDTVYKWSHIKETAILDFRKPKRSRKFLVLLFTDNTYDTREISNFSGGFLGNFPGKLSAYIEHYKTLYKQQNIVDEPDARGGL